jgi:hypothetical protein
MENSSYRDSAGKCVATSVSGYEAGEPHGYLAGDCPHDGVAGIALVSGAGHAVGAVFACGVHPRRGDLCDRCGAQAYVRVLLPNSGELLFCAHHGREHAKALAKVAVDIQDETQRLTNPEN